MDDILAYLRERCRSFDASGRELMPDTDCWESLMVKWIVNSNDRLAALEGKDITSPTCGINQPPEPESTGDVAEIKRLRALIEKIDKITIWDTVVGGRQLQEEIDGMRPHHIEDTGDEDLSPIAMRMLTPEKIAEAKAVIGRMAAGGAGHITPAMFDAGENAIQLYEGTGPRRIAGAVFRAMTAARESGE